MSDNESPEQPWQNAPLSIPQKLLKKISIRNMGDNADSSEPSSRSHSPIASPSHQSLTDLSTSSQKDSERSPTPVRSRLGKMDAREQAYQNDPRFRKYVQLIEKNLQSFDAVNEWADIISFLGRLLKSFQAYPQFPVVPRKSTVAKRLAQCLNPGFPAGVHQKTLEVYSYILATIGSDQLAEDLALWSIGLFPFVQHAATHVKPQVLTVFERYFLPLREKLRPAMRGLIIALLPALEEEGSEFFDKAVRLIDSLAETVELPFFYTCLWLVMISNRSLRPPALNYLLRRLPKIVSKEDVAVVLGTGENVSLMIRAFSATLMDDQLLVQRGMLELLLGPCRNEKGKFRMIPHEDLVILLRAALAIVLRKDMSLNRRLYAWLLGTAASSQAQIAYFHKYAEKAATQALRGLFFTTSSEAHQEQHALIAEIQRPYKILISLMDKWEIGQPIVSNIFIDSLISLQGHLNKKSYSSEMLQTANMWMEMVEPYLIWTKLFGILDLSFPGKPAIRNGSMTAPNVESELDNLRLVEFTLKSFRFSDEEIRQYHLPMVVATLTKKLQQSIHNAAFIDILPQVNECVELIMTILQQLPDFIFLDRRHSRDDGAKDDVERKQYVAGMDILEYARELYGLDGSNRQSIITGGMLGKEEGMKGQGQSSEEAGDLSTTTHVRDTQLTQVTRPEYDSIRGLLFVQELIYNLSHFLVELVNNYTVLDKDNMGIDVGVDGKRLRAIDVQLEKILHGVCAALEFVARHIDKRFTWKEQDRLQLLGALLKCCQKGREFGVVDAGLSTLTQLIGRSKVLNGSVLQNQVVLGRMMDKLWGFLSPSMQLLHMRTVELIWLLTEISPPHQIETIMSNYLIVPNDVERMASYEKFGVFWELSENRLETSTVFSRPMFLMLDLLRDNSTPFDRRAGETWIRCHLQSYVRLLEPFILTMLKKDIIYRTKEKIIHYDEQELQKGFQEDVIVPYFIYMRPFDMETVDYLFTTLVALLNFGGLGVLKAFRSHSIGVTGPMPSLVQQSLGISESHRASMSFLELLVRIALRFLQSVPCEKHYETMIKTVHSIQLHAADLLYLIISKLDVVDMKITELMQEGVLHKSLFCIATGDLDLQQKLLHLLHATMAITAASALGQASTSSTESHRRKNSLDQAANDSISEFASSNVPRVAELAEEASDLARSTSGLYVKCVTDALTSTGNHPILQHWMDFCIATLPHVRGGFRQIVVPLLICVCQRITLCHTTVRLLMHGDASQSDGTNAALPCIQERGAIMGGPERDILTYLNGLEKILMFCLTERSLGDEWYDPNRALPIPKVPERSELRGLVDLVHGEEGSRSGEAKPRDTILYHLPVLLHILLDVWRVFRRPDWSGETTDVMGHAKKDAALQSFGYAADRVKARLENIFERLYKHCTVEFIESFAKIFFIENPIALEYESFADQYDLITIEVLSATPTNSPQHILSVLLEGIRQRTPGMQLNRRRNILRSAKLTDVSLMRFAEIYCGNLIKAESVAHLWPLIQSFAKDYLTQAATYKTFLPGLLRFLTVALEGLTRSSIDKKTRKDAQDMYQRCVDYCILIAGRSLDQSLWIRRSTVYDDDNTSASRSETSLADTIASDVSRNLSSSNVSDLEKKARMKSREDVMIAQINEHLATTVIPNLKQLVGDQDRINSLLNNLVYYVIGPALRTRTMFSKIAVILDQICEMAKMPFTYRTWRKEVWDVFVDNRFFYMNAMTAKKWRTIIQTAFVLEKERFTELIGRITTTPSTAFFTNKEQETLNRALSLRRLSYVIFCGSIDQYVPQLPIIQEKLVELLKLDHGEMVHVEIYLCLRIMLIRFSQNHLLNFWPVLITELMRLFNAFLYNNANDRPEEAQIALAGCKFLDLLCTLEMDAFQIYQWIFIRDTVETIVKPQMDGPVPMMEMLEERLNQSPHVMDHFPNDTDTTIPSLGELKRPMLTMHSISSIKQLTFFIEHISLYIYQSSFTLAKADMPFIESLLQNDLLEGDIDSEQ
ncbi:hypothetical protein EC973_008424 [Apophysomyces ossiformis]|uniref:Dopey N-terminal domain-containing protein n=1 Tax=Apophysomyces ossiformis TaxID=679940 RepID=A0A8H7BN20_9FUNG|nr:hypothetical protein EC973_008424 [Apophysomyces ossiformis]